jgi:hypothetical protein
VVLSLRSALTEALVGWKRVGQQFRDMYSSHVCVCVCVCLTKDTSEPNWILEDFKHLGSEFWSFGQFFRRSCDWIHLQDLFQSLVFEVQKVSQSTQNVPETKSTEFNRKNAAIFPKNIQFRNLFSSIVSSL